MEITLNNLFGIIKDVFELFISLIKVFLDWLLNVNLTNFIISIFFIYLAYKISQKLNDLMMVYVKKKKLNKDHSQTISYISTFVFILLLIIFAFNYFS
jgi:hypothetical protein